MVLRRASLDDAPEVAWVHVRSWKETYPGLLPREELEVLDVDERAGFWERVIEEEPETSTLVDEADGEVVGFASAGPATEELAGEGGEVYALYVLEAHQGEGRGRRLFEAAVEELRGRGLEPVYLWVLAGNPARGFYEHLGGEAVRKRVEGEAGPEICYRWG